MFFECVMDMGMMVVGFFFNMLLYMIFYWVKDWYWGVYVLFLVCRWLLSFCCIIIELNWIE